MNVKIVREWNNFLEYFKDEEKDIYFYEEYVKLYESDKETALCAICEDGEKVLLFPFLRRTIGNHYDFETPYGYGGPIANTSDESWLEIAIEQTKQLFEKEGYICGFIRFHPFLHNERFCQNHFEVLHDRKTVAIDVSKPEEDMWLSQMKRTNRNRIRKAEKNGLVYEADYAFETLGEFVELYNATMERLNADNFYFFQEKYYTGYAEKLKGKAFLGTVRKDGKLICAALFMYSKQYGHYHLAGSDSEFWDLAPTNLLLWKTAVEMHRLGVEEFHLGGGQDSREDNSLLRFKQTFSNHTREFYIGKAIFNLQKYMEIKNNWEQNNPDKVEKYGKLLLCYRY